MEKAIILGLDGASFNVLGPMVNAGILPGLEQAMKTGLHGNLWVNGNDRGWPTILSGKTADELGSFYYRMLPGQYRATMTFDPAQISRRTFLDELSASGKKIISVNTPLTYPAWEVNGIIISGAGGGTTPRLDKAVYPVWILEKYANLLKDYVFDLRQKNYTGRPPRLLMADLLDMTRKRLALVRALMENENWDLFLATFVGMDRIQHWLWDALPYIGRGGDQLLTPMITSYYELIDRFITEILEKYPDVNLLIVSDHGFQPIDRYLYLNDFLSTLGCYRKRHGLKSLLLRLTKSISRSLPKVKKQLMGKNPEGRSNLAFSLLADWRRTMAFGDRAPGIWLNSDQFPEGIFPSQGKEYELKRDLVMDQLQAACKGREPFLTKVSKREDLYTGAYSNLAPDIIIEPVPGIEILAERDLLLTKRYIKKRDIVTNWEILPRQRSGIHSPEAAFAGVGPNFHPGHIPAHTPLVVFAQFVLSIFGSANNSDQKNAR